MLLSLDVLTTLSDEKIYSILRSQQEKIYYLPRTVTDLTVCLTESTTPSETLKTESVANLLCDFFPGDFRKPFIRDPIQKRTATSSGANATSSGKSTTYADQFKGSSNKVYPTPNGSTIDACFQNISIPKDRTTVTILIGD